MKLNPFRVDPAHPFQLVKFLSISTLVLIMGSSVLLSVFTTNYVKNALVKKNNAFAQLLAENLNHQIYRRFTLPVVLGFGHVELKRKDQYERLQQVIDSTIHSFHVQDLRIYDTQAEVAFSTRPEQVGDKDMGGQVVAASISNGEQFYELQNTMNLWDMFFTFRLQPGEIVLRTVYPLRSERDLRFRDQPGVLLGVLEFTQDVSNDYETVLHLQRLIMLTTLLSSAALYGLLVFLIRKADRVLADRQRDKERLERELLQNEKLASMGRMVASIAHEIRNPLGIIRSSSELLRKKEDDPNSTRARMLEAIFHESKRLSQTVNDFLDYARPRQPALQDVDLEKVVRHAVGFLTQNEQQLQVSVESSLPEGYMVQGDKDLLYRGFYNLISNAMEACDKGGRVHIEPVCHEDCLGVLVRDTGPGFDAGLMDRYVEPFFTTKETGTGLGLAITSSIFQIHGADLLLRNGAEGGAEALIVFSEPCQ